MTSGQAFLVGYLAGISTCIAMGVGIVLWVHQ